MKRFITSLLKFFIPTLFLRNSPTVRYAFSVFAVLALVASVASIVSNEKATVVLETSQTNIQIGDTFTVRVYAVAQVPVNAISLAIAVPTDMVEVLSIDRGQSVITLWTADPRVVDGVVYLEGGTYRRGFIGKHLIATLNVRAKKTGQANIVTDNLELLAGDGRGTPIKSAIDDRGQADLVITDSAMQPPAPDAIVVIVSDLNGDGIVSFSDIQSFMAAWFSESQSYDLNQDGQMTFRDFSILLFSYFEAR